jgi:signal transduction histidine kinase
MMMETKTAYARAFASVRAGIHCIRLSLFEPRATNEDDRRRERILTIILFGITTLTFIGWGFAVWQYLFVASPYHQQSPLILTTVLAIFIGLFTLTRKGYYKIAGYIFLVIFYLINLHSSLVWGISLPMGMLTYALLITIASIVESSRFGVIVTCITIATIGLIGHHEVTQGIIAEWKKHPIEINDLFEYGTILSVTTLISWLANKEMEKSLVRARASEEALQHERDNLETLVIARTEALQRVERERMAELYRFAEFGKLSAGLFHDLVNPLTAISLTVEKLKRESTLTEVQQDAKQSIDNAVEITKRMGEYMTSVRQQIKSNDFEKVFSVHDEIQNVVDVFKYQARKAQIEITVRKEQDTSIFGSPLKLNQILSNLVANAIDAYSLGQYTHTKSHRIVKISSYQKDSHLILQVMNYGEHIPEQVLPKLFTPFFTTKEKGVGLGLSTTKDIAEKHFKGTIHVMSSEKSGTVFTVTIPLPKKLT